MLGRAPRPPERLLEAGCRVRGASEDEEKIGKPVQVDERDRIHGMSTGRGERLALRATADRTGDVKSRRNLAPAGEDEALELGQLLVEVVAVALQRFDLRLGDPKPRLMLHRHREIGAQVEELVLDAREHLADRLRTVRGDDDPDGSIQLVHGSEGRDPGVELRDSASVPERRFPCVAGARVDPRQTDGLVAFAGHARRLGAVPIRLARTGEADTIADVFVASFRELTFLPNLHTDDQIRDWIRDEMVPAHEVWVAEADGRIVGFAALTDDLLGHLYVHPEAQSQGVGTALLEWAKSRRPCGFRLWVFQKNEGARRFYERHGFHLVELTDGSGNEEREPDALYEWRP